MSRRPGTEKWRALTQLSHGCAAVALLLLLAACRTPDLPVDNAPIPDAEAARLAALVDVCTDDSDAQLCSFLRDAEATAPSDARELYEQAREIVRRRFAENPSQAMASAPVRYYLRERIIALLAWYALGAPDALPPDWSDRVDGELEDHFPLYSPRQFHLARAGLPLKSPGCDGLRGALLVFPGVVRVIGHTEFGPQLEALQSALPCLETYRVPTKSFIAPKENAKDGCRTLRRAAEDLGSNVPIHMLGYSQGARNALQTLLACPGEAERTRTLVTLNSAARGSELVDILGLLLPMPRLQKERCERFGCFRGWWCRRNPGPWLFARAMLPAAALAMGAPIHDVDEFLESEGLEGGSLSDFLLKRVDGVRSLSTYEAVNFWSEAADTLPGDVLYLSFRSIVSDPDRNLPASNALFYQAIRRAGGRRPQNDMQVRLVNQRLGGPLSRVEVVGPVAEGNHWQWQMNPDELPEYVMPDAMFEGIPRSELLLAYYQTLNEAGILLAPTEPADAE